MSQHRSLHDALDATLRGLARVPTSLPAVAILATVPNVTDGYKLTLVLPLGVEPEAFDGAEPALERARRGASAGALSNHMRGVIGELLGVGPADLRMASDVTLVNALISAYLRIRNELERRRDELSAYLQNHCQVHRSSERALLDVQRALAPRPGDLD